MFTVGNKVKGTYHGHCFTGTITKIRAYTMANNVDVIDIDLDKEITVYGGTRSYIHTKFYSNGIMLNDNAGQMELI
jgi:hypothetical protein